MRKIITIRKEELTSFREGVLENQSLPKQATLPQRIEEMIQQALDTFFEVAEPLGIMEEISLDDFDIVYDGEGFNETITPLEFIFTQADNLALFAVTIGVEITRRIDELFEKKEFALGSMLDSVASAGTDRCAHVIEKHFNDMLFEKKELTSLTGIMRYSPGYCGWHISTQKKLFEYLKPKEIGISLLESYLMTPLKSITGVLVAGKRTIHIFNDDFPFCSKCKNHSCQNRIKELFADEGNLLER